MEWETGNFSIDYYFKSLSYERKIIRAIEEVLKSRKFVIFQAGKNKQTKKCICLERNDSGGNEDILGKNKYTKQLLIEQGPWFKEQMGGLTLERTKYIHLSEKESKYRCRLM